MSAKVLTAVALLRAVPVLSFSLMFFFATCAVQAQDLVPNGSFEAINSCPSNLGGIDYSPAYTSFPTVKGWISPISTTPDYFNKCDPGTYSSVPRNNFGYQQAHSGNGYVGLITHQDGIGLREYVSAKLNRPMVKDSIYHVSFYVNSADGGDRVYSSIPFETVIAVNDIGANLSDTLPASATLTSLNLPYHIINDTNNHLSDTSLWYHVAGEYIAKGGERWITLGRFTGTPLPAYTIIAQNASSFRFGYTYIDDVSILPVGKHVNTGLDRVAGLAGVSVYPNPATDRIYVSGLADIPGNKTVIVYDITGVIVSRQIASTATAWIDISVMPAGVYFVAVRTDTEAGFYRIIKQGFN